MPDSVLLVDLSAVFWAAWHSSANDEVSAARARSLALIQRITSEQQYVAICCDSPTGRSFRNTIYADYKANRPAKDKAAIDELRQLQDRLAIDGFVLWYVDNYEADDVIASACAAFRERGVHVVIATADKDLMQLVSDADGISILSTRTNDRLHQEEVFVKFGVPPERMRDYLALVGDASDNVPGVPRVGAKTAAQLITSFGSLEQLYAALEGPEISPEITKAVALSLRENKAAAVLSRELVTLRTDAPIDIAEVFKPRETKPLPTREYDDGDVIDAEVEGDDSAPAATAPEPPKEEGEQGEPVAGEKPPPGSATALAVRPVSYEQELQPRNVNQAWTLAKGIYQSRLYAKFPNPESIWAIIIRGREMGLGALTALDCFHVIDGKPYPYAWLIIARAKAHPDCEYMQCVESSATSATWVTKNRKNPEPTRLTYTYTQAVIAKLPKIGTKGPNGWHKNPDDMLRKACGSKLARMEYPDASLGLHALEEMESEEGWQ